MSDTQFLYDKSSDPPTQWNDDARINLLAFPSVVEFQSFLKGLGIATQLINGGAVMAHSGSQIGGALGTYVELGGLIDLTILWKKYAIAHEFGLKIGHEGTLSTNKNSFYLTIFNNADWYLLYQGVVNADYYHHININSSRKVKVS
jgi:hypothetical protein